MIEIECYPVGELQANCYYVFDTEQKSGFIVDPGDYSAKLNNRIKKDGEEKIKYILLTHGHFDHIGYTAALKTLCPSAKIVIGKDDSRFTENDVLNLSIKIPVSSLSQTADRDFYILIIIHKN